GAHAARPRRLPQGGPRRGRAARVPARRRGGGGMSAWRPSTRAVRAGIESDPAHGAVVPPIYLSTNYTFADLREKRPYDYTRSGNRARDQLATALAGLEGGAGAVVTSSGMSAVALALQLVPPGGRVVAPHDGYGGTWRLLDALARRGQLRVDFADLTDPASRRAALAERADVVW